MEIQRWRDHPAVRPVPEVVRSHQGEVDFTPRGAALYRRVAAEWLGAAVPRN